MLIFWIVFDYFVEEYRIVIMGIEVVVIIVSFLLLEYLFL